MSELEYSYTDNGVAIIVLNNPPQNRFMGELTIGFRRALQDLSSRKGTRALLIKATGPNFSFGGNVAGWIGQSKSDFSSGIAIGLKSINIIEQFPFPVIIAVQGYCGGGGFELALRGDIVIAADDACFCHSEATLSAFTFMGGIQRVAARVGQTRAIQWAMTAEQISAQTALDVGLINEVVPRNRLDHCADKWIDRFKDSATLSHAAHKEILRAWARDGISAADEIIPDLAGEILHSEDCQSCLPAAAEAVKAGSSRPEFKFKGR